MLFPSTLVVSEDLQAIDSLLSELGHPNLVNNPDIFFVNEYTVENIRQIKKFLSITPHSHENKIVIIPNADLLNLESQNTLLKNLEEPGKNNYFILITAKPNALLPTVVSRCHTIKKITKLQTSNFEYPQSIKACLATSESFTKENTLAFLEEQIRSVDPQEFNKIKKLIKATQMLKSNIDYKTVLDFLFLSL